MERKVLNGEMEIVEKKLTIKEFVEGYVNNENEEVGGVATMNGKVIIRPKYQRSYIRANDTAWKRNLVNSILNGYPISLFYFGDNENGTFDMIDGQQRSITICDFINHGFNIVYNNKTYFFENLPQDIKEKIYSYQLRVNVCIGSQSAKLKWFEIINQPISELTKQELRNATYSSDWLEKLKKHFSAPTSGIIKEVTDKSNRYAAVRYKENPLIERQQILEMALDWASYNEFPQIENKDKRIEEYMAKHQRDSEITEVDFYHKVIDWIWATFLDLEDNVHSSRKVDGTPHSMANVNWGRLYHLYHANKYDTKYISKRLGELLDDNDIVKKHGIYEYLLSGEKDECYLQIRAFSGVQKSQMYSYQGGIDPIDGKHYSLKDMETHHIKAWRSGGKTEIGNCILLAKRNHIDFHNHCTETEVIVKRRDELWEKNNPKEYAKYIAYKEVEERFK
jgi:hypothetical protein